MTLPNDRPAVTRVINQPDRTGQLSREDVAWLHSILASQHCVGELDIARKERLNGWLEFETRCRSAESYCRPTGKQS